MFNSFGHLFRVTTWGESHGPALGCVVDGCPPGIALAEADIQPWLDARRPGQNKFTTQRQEADQVEILSGTFEGQDHRHADLAADPQHRPAVEGLWRDRREVPARPRRPDLPPEVRPPRLSRRRPLVGARDRGAGGRGRRRARRRWRRCCRRSASAAPWCRWATGGSTAPPGTGTRCRGTRSGAPTRRPPPTGRTISTACASPATRSGAVIELVADGVPAGLGRAGLRQARQRPRRADDDDQRGQGRRDRRRLRRRRADRQSRTPTRSSWATTARASPRTTPAASSAASRPARTSSCASRSSRPRRS